MKIELYSQKIILEDLKNHQFQKGLRQVGLILQSNKELDLFSIILDLWDIQNEKKRELAFMHYFSFCKQVPIPEADQNNSSLELLSKKLTVELKQLSEMDVK